MNIKMDKEHAIGIAKSNAKWITTFAISEQGRASALAHNIDPELLKGYTDIQFEILALLEKLIQYGHGGAK